ncbi:uncharacterized protein METZ01_LOCUS437894 [marine metagenome]|uniref:Excinuclease ATPase subunit n=1 Tax=marine metagenome TaxID=408172 RepID=A0A382YPQ1_9ZZZZ
MQKYLFPLVAFIVILSSNAKAADEKYLLPIDAALTKHSNLVDPNIELYFATQPHGEIIESLGTFVTNKKTNARLKSPDTSCSWVFMSAILALQQRAALQGGNAVVNIHSFYKKIEMFSEQKYECHDGRNVSGVALKGTVVRLEK